MQNSSEFQYIAIDLIDESTTNPRKTFDESKLIELAESIRHHGLIQPIVVRPKANRFELVAGARRFRSSLIAEQFSVPAHIVELTDAQSLEWQLVENSQRIDVHPYEEAQGFQRLLDVPGYDVAALVAKSGKSASHIYARLSLLQLIPSIAEAFTEERITTSHANLLARLPQEFQLHAYEQCWRKDWKDDEPHLLPAKHLTAWIQANLYLSLADAPFDHEDPTLNPTAGACVTCPRRSGYNTSLFCDVQGDQCLDAACYRGKVETHLDREIAARPELVQIETAWRIPKEQRPGILERGQFREIETTVDNPDAEQALPCAAAKTAIIVFGRHVGTTLTVCTDLACPVHNPRAVKEPISTPAPEEATVDEATPEQEQRRREFEEERERKAEERKREFEARQAELEAERTRAAEAYKARLATLDCIVESAPETFRADQLRVFLAALIEIDPYDFIEDVASSFVDVDDASERTPEEILVSTLANLPDAKLMGFALRMAFTGHTGVPRENDCDHLAEAEKVFVPQHPQKKAKAVKAAAVKTPAKAPARKATPKKRVAA